MSIWQKVKLLFKKKAPTKALVPGVFTDGMGFPTVKKLVDDPNIKAYTPTGSYYLLGVTTTDRDIVCLVGDLEKAKRDYTPTASGVQDKDPTYPETVVKFTENGVLFNLIFVTEQYSYFVWKAASALTWELQLRDKEQRVLLFSRMRALAKSVAESSHPLVEVFSK